MTGSISALVVSRGHAFDRNAFSHMLDSLDGVLATHVEHPAAGIVLGSDAADVFDAVLFYDMCGIPGVQLPGAPATDESGQPPTDYRQAIEKLLARGTGIVLLNHATVSWPQWSLWREITASSFMLRAGDRNGHTVPGSGYRGGHGPHRNPTFRVVPQSAHPVLLGIGHASGGDPRDASADASPDGFEITDELYLKTYGFESGVLPLLRADYLFEQQQFSPPPMASVDEQAAWNHPPGSDLVVWANACHASPIVVCELGDGPDAFANPGFRRLVSNALAWTSSEEARDWAATWRSS